MVSELSARLMQHNKFSAPTTALKAALFAEVTRSSVVVSPTNISDHEPMMTISACTEKLHKISTKSPSRKTPRSETDTNGTTAANDGCFKRRKVDELQFAASRVQDDLTKGGLSYPALDTSLRHHLDLERSEDATRGVSLVCSKSVSDSPFLTKNASKCSEMATMMDFGSLFSATFDCYSKHVNVSSNATFVTNSDVGSICSLTSEKSEPSYIAPRLEDALNNKEVIREETPEDKEQAIATALQHRAIYSNPITIRDAFENSDAARIVTLSFAPFLVVHINPAYTRMTGLSPADILGKPFHEVIEDPSCRASTAKASSLTSLHEKVTSFAQSKEEVDAENNMFRVHVSVVGLEAAERTSHLDQKNFTHYMISLEEHQESIEDSEEEATGALPLAAPAAASPNATTTANHLVVPPLPILEPSNVALMPTMRLHCGVMG